MKTNKAKPKNKKASDPNAISRSGGVTGWAGWLVHDHAPNEGKGLLCRERLIGECFADKLWQEIPVHLANQPTDIQVSYYNGSYQTVMYLRRWRPNK